MKKFAMFLAFVSTFLMGSTAYAELVDFNDLLETEYRSSIIWMAENDIVNGYDDGSFGVDKCVNRVELLKMLFLMNDVDPYAFTSSLFKDTPEGQWYTPYVKTARAKGVVNGYPDGTFKPGNCVNRAEAIKMAVIEFFGDVPEYRYYYGYVEDLESDQWYYDYVDYVLSADAVGLMHTESSGYNDFKFFPGDSMTRAEVAEMLYRLKTIRDNRLEYYSSWEKPEDINFYPFYLACNYNPPEDMDKLDAEDLMPTDSSVLFVMDHSNSSQLKYLNSILDKFPDSELWESFKAELADDGDFWDFVNDDWKLYVAANLDEKNDDFDAYIVGQAEDGDALEEVFGNMLHKDMRSAISCEDRNRFEFWTSEIDEFYGFRYDDMLFATNKKENRDAITRRILMGDSGADLSQAANKLMYLYLDSDALNSILADSDFDETYMNLFDYVEASMSAKSTGLAFSGETKMTRLNSLWEAYRDYEVALVDKVPSDGMIAYLEEPNLKETLKLFLYWDYASWGRYYDEYPKSDIEVYEEYVADLSEEFNMMEDDIDAVMDSPFALALADIGEVYPGILFYIQLDSDDIDAGLGIADRLDDLVDESQVELAVDYGEENGILTQMAVDSQPDLRKVIMDMSMIPGEETSQLGEQWASATLEYYYGVTTDNVFVVALYPDLPNKHGKNVLDDAPFYNTAVSKLSGVYGADVTYIDFEPLFDIVDRNIDLLDLYEDEMEMYETVKDYFLTMKYLISSTEMSGYTMKSNVFVAF
ncbi:hypothetical protein GF354_02695 [Candidatus Peregrinibacteria bacterium]|nr:hypothetical protein [Candidatus Peregrinibacteria bacterium]